MAKPDRDQTPTRRVGILVFPGFALMSFAATVEPFRAANLLAGRRLYDLTYFSSGTDIVQSSTAAGVTCSRLDNSIPKLDYLFVVAGGDPTRAHDPKTFSWIRRLATSKTKIGGVSGGPVILARAGVMAGRRMTVHWEHALTLKELDPELLLERSIYVMDRDRLTCAGGIAALDMVHSMITEHHGSAFADRVSDWFLHTEIRPGFGPQRGGIAQRLGINNASVIDAVRVMEDRIAEPLGLPEIASIVGLSARQLNRLFQTHLGSSAIAYYETIRLSAARALLRHSSLSVTDIAHATGYASLPHFSARFTRASGETPSSYRKNHTAFDGR